MRHITWTRAAIACAVAASIAGTAGAAAFETYGTSYRSFSTPPIAPGSFSVQGDALVDGRLITATGNSIYVETGVGTGDFELAATIDPSLIDGTDPGFVRVSPDGSRVALGGGFERPMLVFDTADAVGPSRGARTITHADVYEVDHFGAAWRDDGTLAYSSSGGTVNLLDVATGEITVAIENVGGASAGVAFDADGRLYTANGFDFVDGGSVTGEVRVFDPAEFASGPADFENGGVSLGAFLSGSPLLLDNDGNLIVGGGDSVSGDVGYVGVLSQDAISEILLAGGRGALDPADVRELDPVGTDSTFFGAAYNGVTGELYVTDGSTWYATIPAPGAFALAAPAGALLARRRRRAH